MLSVLLEEDCFIDFLDILDTETGEVQYKKPTEDD